MKIEEVKKYISICATDECVYEKLDDIFDYIERLQKELQISNKTISEQNTLFINAIKELQKANTNYANETARIKKNNADLALEFQAYKDNNTI